jgi:peroxin-3
MSHHQSRRTRKSKQSWSFTGLATKAVLAYGTYKLASWAWSSYFQNDETDQKDEGQQCKWNGSKRSGQNAYIEMERRQKLQLQKCSHEIVITLSSFFPTLQSSIESFTNFSLATNELKLRRDDSNRTLTIRSKEDLWNEIKIKSMTRMIGTLYAHSVLYLVLTVQVHLLAGHVFRQRYPSWNGDSVKSTSRINVETQKVLLTQSFEYFFETGVLKLLTSVERVIEQELKDWNVICEDNSLGRIDSELFQNGMDRVCKALEIFMDGKFFQECICPANYDQVLQDEIVIGMLDEVMDILESPSFDIAKNECLDVSFRVLKEEGWQKILFDSSSSTTMFLANAVTRLKNVLMTFYSGEMDPIAKEWAIDTTIFPNPYVASIQSLQSIKDLGKDCFTFH